MDRHFFEHGKYPIVHTTYHFNRPSLPGGSRFRLSHNSVFSSRLQRIVNRLEKKDTVEKVGIEQELTRFSRHLGTESSGVLEYPLIG